MPSLTSTPSSFKSAAFLTRTSCSSCARRTSSQRQSWWTKLSQPRYQINRRVRGSIASSPSTCYTAHAATKILAPRVWIRASAQQTTQSSSSRTHCSTSTAILSIDEERFHQWPLVVGARQRRSLGSRVQSTTVSCRTTKVCCSNTMRTSTWKCALQSNASNTSISTSTKVRKKPFFI